MSDADLKHQVETLKAQLATVMESRSSKKLKDLQKRLQTKTQLAQEYEIRFYRLLKEFRRIQAFQNLNEDERRGLMHLTRELERLGALKVSYSEEEQAQHAAIKAQDEQQMRAELISHGCTCPEGNHSNRPECPIVYGATEAEAQAEIDRRAALKPSQEVVAAEVEQGKES